MPQQSQSQVQFAGGQIQGCPGAVRLIPRLKIRYKDESGRMQLCHTLNNTCVAPPRMLIAFLENNLQPDGTVLIPKVLQPYMGGCEKLVPKR